MLIIVYLTIYLITIYLPLEQVFLVPACNFYSVVKKVILHIHKKTQSYQMQYLFTSYQNYTLKYFFQDIS